MRTYQVIIVDGAGSHTIRAQGRSLRHAIEESIASLPYTKAGVISVTATTL